MTGPGRTVRADRSAAEWVAFGIAAAVLVGVLAAVGWLWVTDDGMPARVEARRSGSVRVDGDRHYVPVTVTNSGDRTASAVQVVAELSQAGEVVEDGEQLIDFLAAGETAEIEFVFSRDPGAGDLTVRAASYAKP